MRSFTLFIFISLFLFNTALFAQKIGIVFNINPKAGYTCFKGAFASVPIVNQELEYDLNDYLKNYFDKRNINSSMGSSNDFAEMAKAKFSRDYLKDYCNRNNLDQLLIIEKPGSYTIADPMEMFASSKSDFGIAAFTMYETRAVFYFNFYMTIYDKSKNSVKKVLAGNFFTHKFSDKIYDEKNSLINKSVMEYYLPIFEDFAAKKLEKSLN